VLYSKQHFNRIGGSVMDKKRNKAKELLKIITPETIHPDELVKTKKSDWNSFFENDNSVDENFMNDRENVIEEPSKSIFDDN